MIIEQDRTMKHCRIKTIETERLILRAFQPSDAEAAFRNWTSDERVTEYLRWPTHSDVSVTGKIIKEWAERSAEPDFYQWAIVLKEPGEPIGSISVVDMDFALEIVHIGYCIGSRWWHQGIMTEAFGALIPFLFEEVGVNRIESQHDPDNPHSGDVMKKCGLKYEGTLRQADYSNRGVVDAAVYSLLRSDWNSTPDNNERKLDRIIRYEKMKDLAESMLESDRINDELKRIIDELDAYYTSAEWKQDFADDEAGLLPGELKRGVLSEDGLFDLIEKYHKITDER